MNKPLLQWKREIEEDIQALTKGILNYKYYRSLDESKRRMLIEEKTNQLQMIDDIIEDMNSILEDKSLSDTEYQICRKYRNKVVGLKEEWE